jgi:hypothetical protein
MTNPWHRQNKENKRRLQLLKAAIKHKLRGFVLEEHRDLLGFVIRDTQPSWRTSSDPKWTEPLFTAYVAEEGYTSYSASIDQHGNLDERELAVKAPLEEAVSKMREQDENDRPTYYNEEYLQMVEENRYRCHVNDGNNPWERNR